MNKIKKWTYLYNEVNKDIKKMGLKDLVMVYNTEINKEYDNIKEDKNSIYILDSVLIENIDLYNKLFKNKWDYLVEGTFNKKRFNNEYYTNILNVGNKYGIYALFEENISEKNIKYIINYISVIISDDIVINKVVNISNGFQIIDIALEYGKDIYAIPGDIFNYKSYLSNYVIKQGAIPICGISDIKYILLQKHYKRI